MDLAIRLRAKKADLANRMTDAGHHSPEARAVQTFMRAFDGWCCGSLASAATLVLVHQGMEDWLRIRLARSSWDSITFAELVALGLERALVDRREAFRLTRLHEGWQALRRSGTGPQEARLAILLFRLIEFIERRW